MIKASELLNTKLDDMPIVIQPWYIALFWSLAWGIGAVIIVLVFVALVMEAMHSLSGYNGERPVKYWFREARDWWKEPHT